jgi:hypothetical protein
MTTSPSTKTIFDNPWVSHHLTGLVLGAIITVLALAKVTTSIAHHTFLIFMTALAVFGAWNLFLQLILAQRRGEQDICPVWSDGQAATMAITIILTLFTTIWSAVLWDYADASPPSCISHQGRDYGHDLAWVTHDSEKNHHLQIVCKDGYSFQSY